MAFQRIVPRTLPDGTIAKVYPFHISLEGMESVLLCRDDEDYDHLEKCFFIAALKTNSLVVIHIAMSNHGHICILATDLETAVAAGELVKKRHSQYLSWKYAEKAILSRTSLDVQYLDSDWYVRNTLAYIPRNALDTGCRIEDYRWSGYRGMFAAGRCPGRTRRVSDMGRREKEALFHTHEDLNGVNWVVNSDGSLEPASTCDYAYLESAFNNDQAFFLKTIGTLDPAEMRQKLILNHRIRQTDSQFRAVVTNLADKWYHKDVATLTPEMKARLVSYLYRSYRTTTKQLARCLQLSRETISDLLSYRWSQVRATFVAGLQKVGGPATEKGHTERAVAQVTEASSDLRR